MSGSAGSAGFAPRRDWSTKFVPEHERRAVAERTRARVLAEHTAAHRAQALVRDLLAQQRRRAGSVVKA